MTFKQPAALARWGNILTKSLNYKDDANWQVENSLLYFLFVDTIFSSSTAVQRYYVGMSYWG